MKHITPYKIYERIDLRSLVSPTLSPITTYFETSQGSKYLLSKKGETKRWKSAHANTGGEDTGLKEWYPNSMFVPADQINSIMGYEILLDKGFKVAMSKSQNSKNVFVILKDNQWVPATWDDASPKYVKANPHMSGKTIAFDASPIPVMGSMAVEYRQDPNGVIRSFHPGSPVSKIVPIEQVDLKMLLQFGIKA